MLAEKTNKVVAAGKIMAKIILRSSKLGKKELRFHL
jgi:hypothetical protein